MSHLFKVRAMARRLRTFCDHEVHCLVTDGEPPIAGDGVIFHRLGELKGDVAQDIIRKYKGDKLRWSCKSLFLIHLLESGVEKAIYVDNDICFTATPQPLFALLNEHSVLLTPHHYAADPQKEQFWLEANYRVGLFNAGFVGVRQDGLEAMRWWARCCAYTVQKSAWRGLFDDQKYLDLMPVLFEGTHIVRDRGCNVAGWNIHTSVRTMDSDGKILICAKWPLRFVHFNPYTLRAIQRGWDPALEPLMSEYVVELREADPAYDVSRETGFGLKDLFEYARHLAWLTLRRAESR
jgi:hypothetical protein